MPEWIPGRADTSEFAPHARAYVDLVPRDDVVAAFAAQGTETVALLGSVDDVRASTFAYASGKWTIKQVVGHLVDTERIFTYRALCLARSGAARAAPLPAFEQDDYVRGGEFNGRTLISLLDEFQAVRESTIALFRNLPEDAWLHRGIVHTWSVTVRGLAFHTAGHELHHVQILRERYL